MLRIASSPKGGSHWQVGQIISLPVSIFALSSLAASSCLFGKDNTPFLNHTVDFTAHFVKACLNFFV